MTALVHVTTVDPAWGNRPGWLPSGTVVRIPDRVLWSLDYTPKAQVYLRRLAFSTPVV